VRSDRGDDLEAVGLIEWVDEQARFDELAAGWERLAEPQLYPFLRFDWLHCWWRAFGGAKRLAICTAREGDELTGVFPLCRRQTQLEVMKNVHSPVYRPFARDEETLRAVVDAAVEAAGGYLLVAHLPDGDPAIPMLVDAARARVRLTLVESQHVSPIVRLDGFELARKTGKELARLRRRLEEDHDVAFSVVEPPGKLATQLREGFELEASGWKGERHTAILHSAQTRAFYQCIADSFGATGRLRLSSISVGGRMIAFDLCLIDHDRLWVLKGGYDEGFRRYAPGLLLTLAEIERARELGLEAVELLGDQADWKAKFANDARVHWIVHSYRPRPVPLARYAYRRVVRPQLRRAYRALHGVHG
jgi:CelD/BcsL family acetyltransferase involved in cellulose biosynthesis